MTEGESRTYLADQVDGSLTTGVHDYINVVGVDSVGSSFQIVIGSPQGTYFQAGTTYQAWANPPAGQASLDVGTDARGCNYVSGTFTINELTRDSGTNNIVGIAFSYSASCESDVPAVAGEIRYHSTLPVAAVNVSPPRVHFGDVNRGNTSGAQAFTYHALGGADVNLGAATLAGANSSAFTIVSDNCSGITLAAGNSCTITAAARPTILGWLTAALKLPNLSLNLTVSVPLTANGLENYAGTYLPVTPSRILDTRFATGVVGTSPVGQGATVQLQVSGRGGIPASGVSAVVMNVTATAPTASSYITVYPTGASRPTASSLNTVSGWTGANSVTVALGTGGRVDLFNNAGSTHLIADVVGYYRSDNSLGNAGGELQLVYPERLFDSRFDWEERLPAGEYVTIPVSYGKPNAPGFYNYHIRALAVNITVVDAIGPGYLTAWNGITSRPNASTLNFTSGAVVPNFAIVPTGPCPYWCEGAAGLPSISIFTSMDVHVIVDIIGFYDAGQLANGTDDGLRFVPQTPTRIVDSRFGQGIPTSLGQQGTATITPGALPLATEALALNITAVSPTANTFISAWPYGIDRPTVSALNPSAGQIIPNAAIIALGGPENRFNVFNNVGTVDIVIDQVGSFFFVPGLASGNSQSLNSAGAIAGGRQYQRQAVSTALPSAIRHHP